MLGCAAGVDAARAALACGDSGKVPSRALASASAFCWSIWRRCRLASSEDSNSGAAASCGAAPVIASICCCNAGWASGCSGACGAGGGATSGAAGLRAKPAAPPRPTPPIVAIAAASPKPSVKLCSGLTCCIAKLDTNLPPTSSGISPTVSPTAVPPAVLRRPPRPAAPLPGTPANTSSS